MKIVRREVQVNDDGSEKLLSEEVLSEKVEETIEDYWEFVRKCREQYPEAFAKLSVDEVIRERREEAEREWNEA